jgi:hypothetical protein
MRKLYLLKTIILCSILSLITTSVFAQAAAGGSYQNEYTIDSTYMQNNYVWVYFACSHKNKTTKKLAANPIKNSLDSILLNSTNGELFCYIKLQNQDTFSLAFDTITRNRIVKIVTQEENKRLKGDSVVTNLQLGQIFIVSPTRKMEHLLGWNWLPKSYFANARFNYKGLCLLAVSLPFATEGYQVTFKSLQTAFTQFEGQFFNVGVAVDWKWGTLRYSQNLFSLTYQPNTIEFGGGLVAGLTSYALNSTNLAYADTAGGGKNYANLSIPVLRIGWNLLLSWHSINLLFAAGWELAFGGNAGAFKYQNQSWIGIGAGVQISQITQVIQNRSWKKNEFK